MNEAAAEVEPPLAAPEPARARSWAVVAALVGGYVGIYLCRKNLSVAVPLLRDAFHASKAEVGAIASWSTAAYALGKIVFGPITDRIGGRLGFLGAMLLVAVLGGASAFSPGLGAILLLYSLNRFIAAGGWPAMMNLAPTWFRPSVMGRVAAVLSLAYVFGGIAAATLAGAVVAAGGGWRAVFGVPALVLVAIAAGCALVVRPGPLAPSAAARAARPPFLRTLTSLLARPQFLVVCAMSFTLTLMRESFNTWSVDFLTSVQHGEKSVAAAALGSTTFDIGGALSILAMGWIWDRTRPELHRWLIAGILAVLTVVLIFLPGVAEAQPALGAALILAVGLLVYGPYSLLAGVMAIETGGAELAASASGIIDAVGYLAGVLAGSALGKLLDVGGYALGFRCLAIVTAVSSLLALALRKEKR
jgi:sugar phosphate permease